MENLKRSGVALAASLSVLILLEGSNDTQAGAETQIASLAQGLGTIAIEQFQAQPDSENILDGEETITVIFNGTDADKDSVSMEVTLARPEGGNIDPDAGIGFDPGLLDPATVTGVSLKEDNDDPENTKAVHYTAVSQGADGKWDASIGYDLDGPDPLLLTYTSRDDSSTMTPEQFDANAAQSIREFQNDLRGNINPDVQPAG